MKTTSMRAVFALSLIISPALSQEPGAPRGIIKLGAAKGTTIAYETRAESTEEGLTGPDSRVARNEIVRAFELRIVDMPREGGAVVEYRCTGVRMILHAALGGTLEIDSAKPAKETDPTKRVLRAIFLAEVERPLVLTLDANAKITSIRGVEALRGALDSELAGLSDELREMVGSWFTDDHRREMLQVILAQLPSSPAPGANWEPDALHHFCPGLGGECVRLAVMSHVESSSPAEIVIATRSQAADSRKLEDYGRVTEVKTRARVSRADGLPIEMTVDLESVSQIPLAEGPRRTRTKIHSVTRRLSERAASGPAESRPDKDRGR